ncbi:MAG: type VI secretion system baseplate subunit TssF [Methylococcales bacterium]|nr:type VI secretion system baseplate subunit TssF [Methylococcales bacterium]
MNPLLIEHYQRELQFIREMGAEFAKSHPRIAAGLDLGNTECADPYVERLLESFAFLTARIQLKMEAEFPRFTRHLLEIVYPHYLAPLPSMAVVQFKPDLKGGVTEAGFLLPRHTRLRSSSSVQGRTKCEFQTAHELTLWPLQLTDAGYLSLGEAVRYAGPEIRGIKAALRLRLETVLDIPFQKLSMDRLPVFLHGSGGVPMQLYELILGHTLAVVIQPSGQNPEWRQQLGKATIKPMGFDSEQALLPYTAPSFQGYRLLQEYFALPQRFLFVEIGNLQSALQRCSQTALEIVILLDQSIPEMEDLASVNNFVLDCTPAINLFPKRTDRVHLNHSSTEHHLVVDKTRQYDYEIHSVLEVTGYGSADAADETFSPFYSSQQALGLQGDFAYYTLSRQPVLFPVSASGSRIKSDYLGSEVYISLVDASETPYRSDLKQLGVNTLCTNRDLPKLMLIGEGTTDFTLEISAPVDAVHCLVRPTSPKPSHAEGEYAWRLISHLSLNYLTLVNNDETQGAAALRDLLRLYGDYADAAIVKQIEGLLAVNSRSVVLRIPVPGPMCFGRGIEITAAFDDSAFEGASSFLLGAVLEQFFCKYASINSFTQAVIKTKKRGEIMRWPVRTGTRTLI